MSPQAVRRLAFVAMLGERPTCCLASRSWRAPTRRTPSPSIRLPHRDSALLFAPGDARRVRRAPPPPSGSLRRPAGLDGLSRGSPRADCDARVRLSFTRRGRIGPWLPLRRRGFCTPRGARAAQRRDLQGGDLAALERLSGGCYCHGRLWRNRDGPGRASLDCAGLRTLVGERRNGRATLAREVNLRYHFLGSRSP